MPRACAHSCKEVLASRASASTAVIRALLAPGTDSFARMDYTGAGIAPPIGSSEPLGLDAAATPTQVLATADPYIATTITLKNA